MQENEQLLKEASALLGVPAADVPKAIRNLLDEMSMMDVEISQLTRQE